MYRHFALLSLTCCLLLTTVAQEVKSLPDDPYIQKAGGLKNSFAAITVPKQLTVAFLGGSITNMQGWRNKVDTFLREAYPATQFRFINAGIPSWAVCPTPSVYKEMYWTPVKLTCYSSKQR